MRVLGLAMVLAVGCGGGEPTLLDDPLRPFPARFSEVGLDPDRAIAYAPRHALYANGADKQRHLALPDGARIDISDRASWVFPTGTLLFKTFRFPARDRATETRVLRLGQDGWEYAAYRWRDGEDEADLLELDDAVGVDVEIDGEPIEHLIPGRLDCRSCHESNGSPVLGVDELALGAEGLAALAAAGALDGEVPDDPETIGGDGELERDVLGYLEGNCTHCHNGGDGPSSSYDLRHRVAREALICAETDESQTAPGLRVVPGDPAASVAFLAVSGESDDPEIKEMPPLGVQRVDPDGVALLRAWIESLPGGCP